MCSIVYSSQYVFILLRVRLLYGSERRVPPAALSLRSAEQEKGQRRALPSLTSRSTTCLTFCPLDTSTTTAESGEKESLPTV